MLYVNVKATAIVICMTAWNLLPKKRVCQTDSKEIFSNVQIKKYLYRTCRYNCQSLNSTEKKRSFTHPGTNLWILGFYKEERITFAKVHKINNARGYFKEEAASTGYVSKTMNVLKK